nr:DUF4332 domain-containing protein [Ardenticatena sp.]
MGVTLRELRGMTPQIETKLKALGVKNSDDLLAMAKTPAARRDLAAKLGVDPSVVLELANRADLARIHGIGGVYSDLLEAAGVDTVKELARRNPKNLHATIITLNTAKRLAGRVPSLKMVTTWVEQAKTLPPALEY